MNTPEDELLKRWWRLEKVEKLGFTIGYSFVLFIGLTGNLLLVIVVVTNNEFHSHVNWQLRNLAVASTLRMLLRTTRLLAILKKGSFVEDFHTLPGIAGSVLCKIVYALSGLCTFVFIFELLFMTSERLVVVLFPFRAATFENKTKWFTLAIWTVAALLSVPSFYRVKSSRDKNDDVCNTNSNWPCDPDDYDCFFKLAEVAIYLTVVGPIATIFLLNAAILVAIHKRHAGLATQSSRATNAGTLTHQVAKMLGAMSLVYALTSVPHIVFLVLLKDIAKILHLPGYFFFLVPFIQELGFMIYPWIYPIFVRRFRTKYTELFAKLSCRQRQDARTGTRLHQVPPSLRSGGISTSDGTRTVLIDSPV